MTRAIGTIILVDRLWYVCVYLLLLEAVGTTILVDIVFKSTKALCPCVVPVFPRLGFLRIMFYSLPCKATCLIILYAVRHHAAGHYMWLVLVRLQV